MSFGYCVNVVVLELLRWSINILFPSSFIEGCLIWRTWNSVGKKPFNCDFCETKEYRYIRFIGLKDILPRCWMAQVCPSIFFQPLLFPSEYLEVKCGRGSMLGILFGFAVCSVTHQYSENKAMTESPSSQGNRRPLNSIASIAAWIQHVLYTIWGNYFTWIHPLNKEPPAQQVSRQEQTAKSYHVIPIPLKLNMEHNNGS